MSRNPRQDLARKRRLRRRNEAWEAKRVRVRPRVRVFLRFDASKLVAAFDSLQAAMRRFGGMAKYAR